MSKLVAKTDLLLSVSALPVMTSRVSHVGSSPTRGVFKPVS